MPSKSKDSPEPILLVEDDENDIFLVARLFERSNLLNPLIVLRDGDAAIEFFERSRNPPASSATPLPLLILLDMKLPKRPGHEVLRWLRSQPLFEKLKVVALTHPDPMADVNQVVETGANSCLQKPITFDGLMKLLPQLNLSCLLQRDTTKPVHSPLPLPETPL